MSSDRTARTRKNDWAPKFLEAFSETGNVKEACATVGVGRSTVYERRIKDEVFAVQWDEAEQTSHDTLEREAFRRAAEGTDKPVYQGGKLVGTVREYSDTLLIFLLKARRPEKYRDNHRFELTGAEGGPIQTEDRSPSLGELAGFLKKVGALDDDGRAAG